MGVGHDCGAAALTWILLKIVFDCTVGGSVLIQHLAIWEFFFLPLMDLGRKRLDRISDPSNWMNIFSLLFSVVCRSILLSDGKYMG